MERRLSSQPLCFDKLRSALAVAALAVLVSGCGAPEDPREGFSRVPLLGVGPAVPIQLGAETRYAFRITSPAAGRICFHEDAPGGGGRVLEVALRALDEGVSAALRAAGDESGGSETADTREGAALSPEWTTLRLALPPDGGSGCAILDLSHEAVPERFDTWVDVLAPRVVRSGTKRPWVILYVVDTLRYDDARGEARAATAAPSASPVGAPFSALANDGVEYARAFGVSSWTRPTVASILTGLGPSFHGIFDRQDRLSESVGRLPEWLAEAGWHTVAVSTNPNILPEWGFMPGFDRFIDVDTVHWNEQVGFEGLAEQVLKIVSEAKDQPLFLYVHDNEPHVPYRPLERYREMFDAPSLGSPAEFPSPGSDADQLADARRLYRATIQSAADRFGGLLDALRGAGRYDESLVVLVGDHGEEFREHGDLFHGRTLFQEQLHVPLIIKPPQSALRRGLVASGTVETAVSTEDIAATILAWLDLDPPSAAPSRALPGPGKSDEGPSEATLLFGELDHDGHEANAVIAWPWKYIRIQGAREGRDEADELLFDLVADPGEERDVAAEHPQILDRLRQASESRRSVARSGLVLSCVAGEVDSLARASLRWAGLGTEDDSPVPIGLEPDDVAQSSDSGVDVEFRLRAATAAQGLAAFHAGNAALAQSDRDRVRVSRISGDALQIEAAPMPPGEPVIEWRRADGAPLATDGSSIPLAELATPLAPRDPPPSRQPTCLVYYVDPSARSVVEGIPAELRARLEAIGYLQD